MSRAIEKGVRKVRTLKYIPLVWVLMSFNVPRWRIYHLDVSKGPDKTLGKMYFWLESENLQFIWLRSPPRLNCFFVFLYGTLSRLLIWRDFLLFCASNRLLKVSE